MKAPFSLPAVDQATTSTITVDAPGYTGGQAFLWDGARWRFVGTSAFEGGGYHLLATPMAPATGFLQPDGNIYLLLVGAFRASTWFDGGPVSTDTTPSRVEMRPVVGGGFKSYFGNGRVFMRTELLMSINPHQSPNAILTIGAGVDF